MAGQQLRAGRRRLTVINVRARDMLRERVPELASDAIRCDRDTMCRLNPRWIWSDVHAFVALAETARAADREAKKRAYAAARELYRGDLLTDPYFDWVHERPDGTGVTLREHYRAVYREISQQLARLPFGDGEYRQAIPVYQSLLRLEPTLEDVVRQLFRCYGAVGDRSALLQEERRLWQALRESLADPDSTDLGPAYCQPEAAMSALFQQILSTLSQRGVAERSAVAGRSESVATG